MNKAEPKPGHRSLPVRMLGLLLFAPLLCTCSDSTGPILTFWKGTLFPIHPSVVGGRVVAVTQYGRTKTGITIEDAEQGFLYGWRIDSGTCDENGVSQGGPAAYPGLLPDQSGSASTDTSLPAQFKSGKKFAARVFRSPEGGSAQVVACGNLHETAG